MISSHPLCLCDLIFLCEFMLLACLEGPMLSYFQIQRLPPPLTPAGVQFWTMEATAGIAQICRWSCWKHDRPWEQHAATKQLRCNWFVFVCLNGVHCDNLSLSKLYMTIIYYPQDNLSVFLLFSLQTAPNNHNFKSSTMQYVAVHDAMWWYQQCRARRWRKFQK